MPDTLSAAIDEAAALFDSALSAPVDPSTDDDAPVADASASGAEGTTPPLDDAKPQGQDVAAQVVEEGSVPSQSSDPEGFDPQKTLEKYTTDEAKAQALVEKDKELLKRADQNRKLEAELEALRKGKEPEPTPEPEPEPKVETAPEDVDFSSAHREWLKSIREAKPEELGTQEERVIARSVAVLNEDKKSLDDAEAGVNTLLSKEAELQSESAKLQTIIAAQEADLVSEPDDFALQERLKANRVKMDGFDRQLNRVQNESNRAMFQLRDAKEAFRQKIEVLDDYAVRAHRTALQAKRSTATEAEESKRLNAEWIDGFKGLLEKDLKADEFSETEQENILRGLVEKLSDYVDQNGSAPENLAEFQRAQKVVFERERKHRLEVQQAMLRKKSSVHPSKPKDNELSPTPGSAKRTSFNNEMNQLGARFDKHLGL